MVKYKNQQIFVEFSVFFKKCVLNKHKIYPTSLFWLLSFTCYRSRDFNIDMVYVVNGEIRCICYLYKPLCTHVCSGLSWNINITTLLNKAKVKM